MGKDSGTAAKPRESFKRKKEEAKKE
jgi:hypothetical protein